MAADKATVSVSASLLPDEIKAAVGGTTVYNIDDLKWINNFLKDYLPKLDINTEYQDKE